MTSENRKIELAVAYMQAKSVVPFKMYTVFFGSQFLDAKLLKLKEKLQRLTPVFSVNSYPSQLKKMNCVDLILSFINIMKLL
jgi:hypothetical protein